MSLLLFQVTIVLATCLLCGQLARRLGQARVIGEIFGGILLGPSVFGRISPELSRTVFPAASLNSLEVLSTVGLVLFLFLIGSELDHEHLRRQRSAAAITSLTSVILPFGMAALAAPILFNLFAPPGMGKLPFTLFLGVSMSITAFPVLARILEERQMQASSLGVAALMCAAVDDVLAWTLLAIAMTLIPTGNSTASLSVRLIWLGLYLLVMFALIRPLGRWLSRWRADAPLTFDLLGVMVALAFASAAVTDAIGIHPLFGAFLAGLCFPRVRAWQAGMRATLEVLISLVLLPLFFALTGMRTRLDLLNTTTTWLWTGFVLLLAVVGKMGGAIFAARLTGQAWRSAVALGALLNTRGLVELIGLNIAYSAHVFSPTLFTMLVVMALVTTAMTSPILRWLKIGTTDSQPQDVAIVSVS